MKWRKGPRPWSIWTFALVSTSFAVLRTGLYFTDLAGVQEMFEHILPGFEWNRDWVIVASSAWLTIDLIPVVLVFAFASRFARWFILGMTTLTILLAIYDLSQMDWVLEAVIVASLGMIASMALVGLLFLPASNRWFANSAEADFETFA
jgi:hypothetical protein